jgi:hypothetical protein
MFEGVFFNKSGDVSLTSRVPKCVSLSSITIQRGLKEEALDENLTERLKIFDLNKAKSREEN